MNSIILLRIHRRTSIRFLLVSSIIALLLFWGSTTHISRKNLGVKSSLLPHMPCYDLSGGNNTLVVLRTGSTETKDRFPIHITTSLRCYPHYLIFSDLEEDFVGEHVLNALDSVGPEIIAANDDFAIYRRLKQDGRAAFNSSELSGSGTKVTSASGEIGNPGWKLDKWKFMPMLNRTFYESPDLKWYIFVEADTYILWSTLQRYLAGMDPTQPFYGGVETMIGEDRFAHGGTGFLVSRPALRMLVDYYSAHKTEIERLTDWHWAGDCILGMAFLKAGVPTSNIFPIMQGDPPGIIPYGIPDGGSVPDEPRQVWCSPTVSYHHMSVAAVEDLWHFEQKWMENKLPAVNMLRHKDVFKYYVMPQMQTSRDSWDNLSDQKDEDVSSFEECRARCEARESCKQYSYDRAGVCKTRINPRLGAATAGVKSGWIGDRIAQFEEGMEPCEGDL